MRFNAAVSKRGAALNRLTTPRAAGLAGVLFAVLFSSAIILIRTALPEGAAPGSQWLDGMTGQLRVASVLMPFAGICFLWFIGVVRDGLGDYEDRFFASVFFGSGLLFLAMIFVSSAVGAGMVALSATLGSSPGSPVAVFGQTVLVALNKTYAIRMAAVFMISLATIWLKTGLMPRWLTGLTYASAFCLLVVSDLSMWIVLAFPVWVLLVSLLALVRAGVIDLRTAPDRSATRPSARST